MDDYSYHITLDFVQNNSCIIENIYLTKNAYFDCFTSISELPGTVPAKSIVLYDQNVGCLFRCVNLLNLTVLKVKISDF